MEIGGKDDIHELHKANRRVSLGLTISRKTAKTLAVRRKNEKKNVNRKKNLTIK